MENQHDWVGQEKLYKAAIAAKPLDCGCQHYGYGLMLAKVGRLADAVEQQRAATDMLALWPDSRLALAGVLVATGKVDEAKPHFEAAVDLSTASNMRQWVAVNAGVETGDYAAAFRALRDPGLGFSEQSRAALVSGYQGLASRDPGAKTRAIPALLALPQDEQRDRVVTMLAALGATHEALEMAGDRPWLFWRRSMRGALNDPGFPAVASKLGLMSYWKSSHTKPDVCSAKDPPPFCRLI
jgi:tetratricopeptide (TPR) repeat protein